MASPAHRHLTTHSRQPEHDHSAAAALSAGSQLPWCARPHRYAEETVVPDAASIFGRLTLDWMRITALSDSEVTVTERWAPQEPAVAKTGCTSLPALMDAIDHAPRAEADALLAALLRLHQAGDHMAGQLLLMQMLPGLSGLAPKNSGTKLEDIRGEIVATFWEVMASQKADSGSQPTAANLKLNTLRQLRSQRVRRYEELEVPSGIQTDPYLEVTKPSDVAPRRFADAVLQLELDAPDVSDTVVAMLDPLSDPDIDLLELLARAAASEVISMEDAQLLARMDCPTEDQDRSSEAVGHELGLSATAVRARRSRAIKRLKAWVAPAPLADLVDAF